MWYTARGLSARRIECVMSTKGCYDELYMISYMYSIDIDPNHISVCLHEHSKVSFCPAPKSYAEAVYCSSKSSGTSMLV